MSTNAYKFEMGELRKDVLATVAEYARQDDLTTAKHRAKGMISRRADENPVKAAKAFETSFERAVETVKDGGDYDIEIEVMPPILNDHDAEIDPTAEIDGDPVEVITSTKTDGWTAETSTYPIIDHQSSGFRICTCAAQKYYIVCPHTLSRVIERNWPNAPLPTA